MLHSDFSLLQYNTFGIDEQAKFFFSFSDKQELAAFLKNEFRKDLPYFVLGGGSNVLLTKPFEGTVIHPENKGITCKSDPAMEEVIFNNVPTIVPKTRDFINIIRLHVCLNCVKSSNSCANKWLIVKMKGLIGTVYEDEEHKEANHIKNVKDVSGYYVPLSEDPLLWLLGSMKHNIAALRWYRGEPDWDIDNGDGDLYLIQLPSKFGTNIYKYGKTIYLTARMRVYLRNEPEEFRRLGIRILCLVSVNDTSLGEDCLGRVFKSKGRQTTDGNEFVEVPSTWKTSDNSYDNAQVLFYEAMELLDTHSTKKEKKVDWNSLVVYELGAPGSVFQLEKDKQ